MAKFCTRCGTALIEKSKICGVCGKAVPFGSKILNQQTIDESKNRNANTTSAMSEKDLKVKVQIREELKGINEARSKTFEECKAGNSKGILEQTKALSRSFWGNLTVRQKAIVVGSIVLIILIAAKMPSHSISESSNSQESINSGENTSSRKPDPIAELNSKFYLISPQCPPTVKSTAMEWKMKIRELQGLHDRNAENAAKNLAIQTISYLQGFGCISR